MDKESLILGFFERTLTPAQQAEFDRLVVEDRDFADEVAFRRDLQHALARHERPRLKALLLHHEQRAAQAKRIPRMRWWMAAAAGIVAIAGLSIWLSVRREPADALYATYYRPYPNIVMPVVRGEHDESLRQAAFHAYDRADFARADTLFRRLFDETAEPDAALYRGTSLLELARYRDAVTVLATYPQDGPFGNYARWYRALAHLKMNERDQAIRLLREVAGSADSLSLPARELLEALQ